MNNLSVYPSWSRTDLVDRLAVVHSELAQLSFDKATTLATEKKAKMDGWLRSDATTVAARERDADFNAMDASIAYIECHAESQALEYERDLLLFLLGS